MDEKSLRVLRLFTEFFWDFQSCKNPLFSVIRSKSLNFQLTVSAMIILYSSTVVFSWAFCNKTNSFSATWDVELCESPLRALFNLSLLLFWWLLLAIGELLVLLLRLDLLLTICCLRFSNTLSSHFVPSLSPTDDDVASGKCCAKISFTFVTSTLEWVWKSKKNCGVIELNVFGFLISKLRRWIEVVEVWFETM